MSISIPWSRLQLLIFLDCQPRSADRCKLETMMLSQLRMPERATSLHACSRRQILTPTFRATPSASEKQRHRHTRYRSRLLCKAASSTEPVDLKFVTQGRNLKLTDALRDFAEEKATKVLARYASAVREVDISLSVSKGKGDDRQKCEFTVFLKRLGVVRGEETAENMYAAIENVSDLIARKMRKVKEKAIASGKWDGTAGPRGHSFSKELPEEYFSDDEEIDLDVPAPLLPPEIHRTKSITLEPMTIQEALFQADQLGHSFFVFKDTNEDVKILYKRRHRGYGLLEPQ